MGRTMRGFTLMELLATVAVLGVLTGLTVTALGPMQARYRRRQAAELVAATAVRARLQARETGRCHVLVVFEGDVSRAAGEQGDRLGVLRHTNADCEVVVPVADLEPVETVRMPDQVSVSLPAGPEPVWRPNGRLRGVASAELRVMAGGGELAIPLIGHGPVCVRDVPVVEACP